MPKYKIFAGLGGGFGGASERIIDEFLDDSEAMDYAYTIACEEYDSYGGLHGLFNEEDALEEDPDLTPEDLHEMYQEDRENWIEYYVELVDPEEDTTFEGENNE